MERNVTLDHACLLYNIQDYLGNYCLGLKLVINPYVHILLPYSQLPIDNYKVSTHQYL